MAAARRSVHSLHQPIRTNRVFRNRTNPLDMYDDIELFQRFRCPRREPLEVIDNFKDDVTLSSSLSLSLSLCLSLSVSLSPPPNIVHGAGNVASSVEGIGDVCHTLAFF